MRYAIDVTTEHSGTGPYIVEANSSVEAIIKLLKKRFKGVQVMELKIDSVAEELE